MYNNLCYQPLLQAFCFLVPRIMWFGAVICLAAGIVHCHQEPFNPYQKCDPPCAEDERCDSLLRKCLPKNCAACVRDADCNNREYCNSKNCCVAIVNPPDEDLPDAAIPIDQDPLFDTNQSDTNPTDTSQPPPGTLGSPCNTFMDCNGGLTCHDQRKVCACIENTHCPATTPRCERVSGKCVACLEDSHCSASHICDQTQYTCVFQCNCPEGQKCDEQGQCVPLCSGVTCSDKQICDPKTGLCKDKPTQLCEIKSECDDPNFCCNEDGSCTTCGNKQFCEPCQNAAECGRKHACVGLNDGKDYCMRSCSTQTDCPDRFNCINLGQLGHQCIPSTGSCQDPCAKTKCSDYQFCCPQDGNCHDCCNNTHCPNSSCDLSTFTCKTVSPCQPPCSGSLKCCTDTRSCHECCYDYDCGGANPKCQNGTCTSPPPRNCKVDSVIGICKQDSDCCPGQTCSMSIGCGPCQSDADCPKYTSFIPIKCCAALGLCTNFCP